MRPSCEYRCVPDADTYVSLLIAMADAVKRMPVLRELGLTTGISCSVVCICRLIIMLLGRGTTMRDIMMLNGNSI